jgi:DnaJ-class molecular chaperone
MPATFGVQNLHGLAPASGYAQESSADDSIEVATIRDQNGVTVVAKPKKLVTKSITISGKGVPDFAGVAVGAISAGTSFITSVKLTESNDDFPAFEIQAVQYSNLT